MPAKLDPTTMSAEDAVKAVANLGRKPDTLAYRAVLALLREAHALELKHPKKPRKSVLNAIEERLGEMTVPTPSPGLARAPVEDPSTPVYELVPGSPVLYTDARGQTHDAEYMHMLSVAVVRIRDGVGTMHWAAFDTMPNPNTWRHV